MDQKIDEFMMKKINEIEVPFDLDIDKIISKSKKNNKRKIEKLVLIAICLILVIIVSFSTLLISSNNNEKNTDLNANINTDEKAQQQDENYGIINSDYMNNTALYTIPDIKETFEKYNNNENYKGNSGIVIAKVEDIKYTNYDKDGESLEYYTFVRGIANIKILKSISSIFNEGDKIEIRANGGIIEYSEYLKEFEQYSSSPDSIDSIVFEQEYKKLVEEGKTKIFVSEYKKLDTKLEKDKTYIMFVFKRNWGDYWIETANTLLREYNEEDNTVLNNQTGEYENLDEVLNYEKKN